MNILSIISIAMMIVAIGLYIWNQIRIRIKIRKLRDYDPYFTFDGLNGSVYGKSYYNKK